LRFAALSDNLRRNMCFSALYISPSFNPHAVFNQQPFISHAISVFSPHATPEGTAKE